MSIYSDLYPKAFLFHSTKGKAYPNANVKGIDTVLKLRKSRVKVPLAVDTENGMKRKNISERTKNQDLIPRKQEGSKLSNNRLLHCGKKKALSSPEFRNQFINCSRDQCNNSPVGPPIPILASAYNLAYTALSSVIGSFILASGSSCLHPAYV